MDVILDSNIYLQDVKMERNQFEELFVYLRRTDSQLVIPLVVFHEVIERYQEWLAKDIDQARVAWNRMAKRALSDIGQFRSPDITEEVRGLKHRLREPPGGIKSVLYNDMHGVNLPELIRRGAKRIRPANNKGEELRDVILWMATLQYGEQKAADIAFLTDDNTFWNDTKTEVHTQIASDIKESRALGFLWTPNCDENE